MSPRAQFFAALAFCALALGAAWYGYNLVSQARVDLIALGQQRRSLEADIRRNQEKLAGEARARLALQARLAGAAPADKGASADARKDGPDREPTYEELLTTDPKLFELFLQGFRANFHDSYGAIYQKLHLSAEQIDKVETMATVHEADIRDLRAAADSQGLSQEDPGIAAMRQQADQKFLAGIVAQLGVNANTVRAAQKDEQKVFRPMQDSVDFIATAANRSEAPLSQAQAAQLAQVMAGSTPEYQAGKAAAAKNIDWNIVQAQAPAFLSGAQLEGVRMQAMASAVQKLADAYVAGRAPPAQPDVILSGARPS